MWRMAILETSRQECSEARNVGGWEWGTDSTELRDNVSQRGDTHHDIDRGGDKNSDRNNSIPEKKNERRTVYGAEKTRAGGGASISRAQYGVQQQRNWM